MRVRNDFTQEMWLSCVMKTNTLAWYFTKDKVMLGLVGQIPRSIGGMLERNFVGEYREIRHASIICDQNTAQIPLPLMMWAFLVKAKTRENHTFATPVYLPSLTFLAFFVTSGRVHLNLQTLICSFLFFFKWLAISNYPYHFQGPKLNSWANFFCDLIHQCCVNYDPNQRVVLSPSGSALFHVTP